jgi:hypothetical protein
MKRVRALLLAVVGCGVLATPAFADLTAFTGANTTPANRQMRGFAVGVGLLVVAFEFEYASTIDDPLALAASLKTGMGNILLQTPFPFLGIQPYVTAGGGLYREELGAHQDTSVGINTGGGAKVSLIGPIRLRIDYRVFKLGTNARHSPTHRVYMGVNLKF